MYRLLAIAKYEERYVIPKAHVEQAHDLEEIGCSLDFDGGPYEMGESGPFGEASGRSIAGRGGDLPGPASSGRPPTAPPPTRPARPGEPAELGRQRVTAGAVPVLQRADATPERQGQA